MEKTNLLLVGMPSGFEWVIVLFIVLLLFGSTKLPQLAKGLGQSIKEFKKSSRDGEEEAKPAADAKKPEVDASKTHGSN